MAAPRGGWWCPEKGPELGSIPYGCLRPLLVGALWSGAEQGLITVGGGVANQPRKGKKTVTWDGTLELSITPLPTSYGSSQSLPGTLGALTFYRHPEPAWHCRGSDML